MITRRLAFAAPLVTAPLAFLAGCTRLDALNGLNTLVPGDGGVRKLANGVVLGPDLRQRLDVWGAEPAGAPRPVIVWFYGGSWNSGDRGGYAFLARALVARGFVVVVPDYRLAPETRFPGFVEDGAAALAWTAANIAKYGGDAGRIALMGHSAGAHIAMLLALDKGYGVADKVKAVVGLAGPYDFLPLTPGGAADVALTSAAARPGGMASTQPISFARADAPPVLLLSGDEDTTVQPGNAQRLAAALQAKGAQATVKLYKGIGHIGILLACSKPFRGKAPVLADAAAFLTPILAPAAADTAPAAQSR
jgi:acetyl esterase/lipase